MDDTKQEFNQIIFRHAPDVEARTTRDGTRLLATACRTTYLALDAGQQRVFDLFDGEMTVQDVLCRLLERKLRPDIREFYELVLYAQEAGFLVAADAPSETTSVGPAQGFEWPFGWHLWQVSIVAALLVPSGLWAFMSAQLYLPGSAKCWLLFVLSVVFCLSLANALAGFVLHGYGRWIYLPGIRWHLGVPYFGIDLKDAFMGGRGCQAACAVQMLTVPFAVGAVAFVAGFPEVVSGSFLAACLLSCPFGNLPGHNLLHASFAGALAGETAANAGHQRWRAGCGIPE